MSINIILSRSGEVDSLPQENQLIRKLSGQFGVAVTVTPHLYHVSENDCIWDELSKMDGDIIFISWLHPRPAEWLLRKHNVGRQSLICYHFSDIPSDPAWGALPEDNTVTPANPNVLQTRQLVRWYPVVDRSRCTNCLNCLQFCLFGVHETDENGVVQVANPDLCKPGCPACSRICPNGAIIFPLYAKDPAIAGAPGLLMQPDRQARHMYYTRTKAKCPKCGQEGPFLIPSPGAPTCEECTRPVRISKPEPATSNIVMDELDALIDQVDSIYGRRN